MKKIGLIAGGGNLPLFMASSAIKNGYEVITIGFDGFTDLKIEDISTKFKLFKLGKIQGPINFLKENEVDKVIMIGNISHINIFSDIRVDLRGANFLFKLKDKSPNGIFKGLAEELEKDNIFLENTSKFIQDSLAKEGILTGERVSSKKYEDIVLGFKIAKKIAEMDIGLSVIIKDKAVIAVEAIEGTDKIIERAGEILKNKNPKDKDFTLVKVARPSQDMRFDLPVIGVKTIENMFKAGGNIIAIEALKTLIVEPEKTFNLAKEKGITIIALNLNNLTI